jgi:hypothetical protein
MGRVPFQIFTGINGLAAGVVIKGSFGYAEGGKPFAAFGGPRKGNRGRIR